MFSMGHPVYKGLQQGIYVYTILMFSMGHPVYKGLEAGYICIYYCQMVDLRNIEDYSVWLNYKLHTYPKKILKHFVIYI